MSTHNRKNFSAEEIRNAIIVGKTMGGAAKVLNVNWRTFKRIASEYGLYVSEIKPVGIKYELIDILNGKYPQYSSAKLSKRLVKEGIKKYECEICGIFEWNNKPITLELNHKDGCNGNHSLDNLELICPNCHSQTDTYRSKNLIYKKKLNSSIQPNITQ